MQSVGGPVSNGDQKRVNPNHSILKPSQKQEKKSSKTSFFLYRLFHTSDHSKSKSAKPPKPNRVTLKDSIFYSDSEDSDSSSPSDTTLAPSQDQSAASLTQKKETNHLAEFIKKRQTQKTPPKESKFIFWHLKPYVNKGLLYLFYNSESPAWDVSSTDISRNHSECSLSEKYGWVEKKMIGRGSHGIVKVSHSTDSENGCEKLYAIKEFKKKHRNESDKSFIKKLTAEFCISSSMHHENVIGTVDLIQNEHNQWCEVMEYLEGGDLCHLIQNKHLSSDETNKFFVQLIHGVAYIHSMGVAHRDLKPENLILDKNGSLKIADFGEAEVFKSPFEKSPHKSRRCCGSQPYMAPEEFTEKEFDSCPIDIFACGVIYLAMRYNRLPWKKPTTEDPHYRFYLSHLDNGFFMIDRLDPHMRCLAKRIIHPDPAKRAVMSDIIENEWFKKMEHDNYLEKQFSKPTTPHQDIIDLL